MIYLSQILGARVRDSSAEVIGQVKDAVITPHPGEYAPLQALFLSSKRGRGETLVPWSYVENLSREAVTLKTLFNKIIDLPATEEHVFLKRDVLDQQIVDLEGVRVVRVNDLQLGIINNEMRVLGIDISFKGFLRRVGLARFDLFNRFKVRLIDWKNAQPVKGTLKLTQPSKYLVKLHPADLANIIEDLNVKQGSKLVQGLDIDTAAKVFEEITPRMQRVLIRALGPERAAKISERMSVDELVDLMKLLPDHEAKEVLDLIQKSKVQKVKKLLPYGDNTAGGLMTSEYVTGLPDWTTDQAISEVKKVSEAFRSINYIFVTDRAELYKGFVTLRRLLVSAPDTLLKNVMRRANQIPPLYPEQGLSEVAVFLTKYDLNAAAVVDKNSKMLGAVTVDDVMRALIPHA